MHTDFIGRIVRRFTVLGIAAITAVFFSCGKPKIAFKAGDYTATAAGRNGDIKIRVLFTDSRIKEINVLESAETAGLGDVAIEKIAKKVIDEQTLAVDAVAGATISSKALLAALADCVTQAGANPDALKKSARNASAAKSETYSADIVIVGAGAAGLTAGIAASEAGANVIVLEKGASVAVSNGAVAGGPIAVGTRIQKTEGENLTLEKLYTHMNDFANSTINSSLLHKCLAVSGETIDMMQDLGLDIYLRRDAYGIGFRARHGIKQKGADRMRFLREKIESKGGNFLFETAGKKLIVKDGHVIGIEAEKSDGTKVIVNAKAVLVATGGYLGSEEFIRKKFGNITVNPLGNTLSTGDGIAMILDAGGVEDRNWGIVANEFSAANKKAGQWTIKCNQNLRFGIYGGLIVNSDGNRFFSEDVMANKPLSGAQSALREGKYYAVMDDAYYKSVCTKGIFETLGKPQSWIAGERNLSAEAPASAAHIKILTEAPSQLAEAIEQGWAYKADTIEEAASHFALTALAKTVARYNALCATGKDEDFYKNPIFLTPVSKGPFYVFEYETSAWCTLGGVKVDDSLRALDANNKPIPGLYAAGIDAGSAFTAPYYDNEGSAFGIALSSGTLAGRTMAAYVKEL